MKNSDCLTTYSCLESNPSILLSPSMQMPSENTAPVGQWLDAPDSALQVYSPTIFPQGSIAIGTTCKPVGRDEMDIDLVCEMILPPEINQSQAKQLVGERLKENATYAEMVNEKNRCWRLIYAGQFYMDILPAKPDGRLPTETALVVPDKKLHHWKETDPKGYAAWFSVKAAQSRIKESITIQASVEPVPEYVAVGDKSPLQIAVQLLKRHRDVSLYGDGDAPISIILTTLAARAYQGQRSIYATLAKLLERMPTVIEYDTDGRPSRVKSGEYTREFRGQVASRTAQEASIRGLDRSGTRRPTVASLCHTQPS